MRYLLFLVVLLALSIGSVAAQDAAQDAVIEFTDHPARVVTNINALNMRSSPAIEADNIVGRLQPGQQVHVLAREGEWQQVRSENGLIGWSHSDYLIDLPARQIGETRLFRIHDLLLDRTVVVNAELAYIGAHSYIYVYRDQVNSAIPAKRKYAGWEKHSTNTSTPKLSHSGHRSHYPATRATSAS